MKGQHLPDEDHFVRYVKPSQVRPNGKISGARLQLRPNETGLSVFWLEIFGSDKAKQLSEVRRLRPLNLKQSGRFARLNVGDVKVKVLEKSVSVQIVSDPLQTEHTMLANPSHSLVLGLPPSDSALSVFIGDQIAKCVQRVLPAIRGLR